MLSLKKRKFIMVDLLPKTNNKTISSFNSSPQLDLIPLRLNACSLGRTSAINKPDDKSDIVLYFTLLDYIPGSTTSSPGSSRFPIWGRGCPEALLRRL